MKAQEVNGSHIGQRFKVSVNESVITDTLISVRHEADVITDTPLGQAEPVYAIGQRRTCLVFLNVGKVGTWNPDTLDLVAL